MRVLICGERAFNDKVALYELIGQLQKEFGSDLVIIHGGAHGADRLAGDVAMELGISIEVFPAKWEKYGQAAGPIRNKQMLQEGEPDIVYAFFVDRAKSKGTNNMVTQAKKANICVVVYEGRMLRRDN